MRILPGESMVRAAYGRRLAALLFVGLTLGACGGSGTRAKEALTAAGTATVSPSASPIPTVPSVRRTSFKRPELIPTATPTVYFSPPPAGTQKAPLTVTMGTVCAQPGEVQTVTIKTTADYNVAWAVLWPDEQPHEEWKAYGITKTPNGTHVGSFRIPLNAPAGRARVDVAVSGSTNKKTHQATKFVFWEIEKVC